LKMTSKELCPKPPPVFVREATGLIRSLSSIDVLFMSLAVTGPNYLSFVLQMNFVGGVDPGADIVLSGIIGLLFMVPLCVMYYLFVITMPRSGGDYVWLSRIVNPVLGFLGGWGMWVAWIVLFAGTSVIFASVVLPVFFVSLGYAWNIPSYVSFASNFSNPYVIFLVAMLFLGCGILINSRGARVYRQSMIVLAVVQWIGTFLALYVLATTSNQTFMAAFNHYGGVNVTYQGIIQQAKSAGWSYTPIYTGATLLAIPFGILWFNGFNWSASAAGEVRNVKVGMLWGIVGALIIDAILNLLGVYWGINMVGYEFNQAATWMANNGTWPFATGAWLSLFTPMVVQNGVVLFLIQLSWLTSWLWWVGALMFGVSRYVFAFSFDRMLPIRFADVSERYKFPINAMALCVVVGVVFIYLTDFTTYIGTYLNATAIFAIVWVLVSVAAIIFPYKRKDLASTLPGSTWPVPLISIIGIFCLVTMSITLFYAFTTPAVGPSTPFSDVILGIIFAVGGVIFVARYLYLKGRGIDLLQAVREIPPE